MDIHWIYHWLSGETLKELCEESTKDTVTVYGATCERWPVTAPVAEFTRLSWTSRFFMSITWAHDKSDQPFLNQSFQMWCGAETITIINNIHNLSSEIRNHQFIPWAGYSTRFQTVENGHWIKVWEHAGPVLQAYLYPTVRPKSVVPWLTTRDSEHCWWSYCCVITGDCVCVAVHMEICELWIHDWLYHYLSWVGGHQILPPGLKFYLKMLYYQYRKSHCGDKMMLQPSPQQDFLYW